MFIDFLDGGYMMFDIGLQLFGINIYRCRIPRKKSLNVINVKRAKNVSCVGGVEIEI